MTLAALASTPARACTPSARRASASRRRAFPSTRPASRLRASDDRISTPSGASSLDALDRVLASADASDAQETAFSHAPARLDPFADPTPEDLRRAASERDATSSGSRSFEGRRGGADRDSMAELLDVRARFQGGAALLRAMTSSDVFAQTLEDVTVGQLAVVGEDYPSLLLWKNQHYEVRRIYFQRSDDEVGAKRVDAATLGEDYPDGGEDVNWTLYVELFSEEYHSAPVRVRPERVGLRTVGSEIIDALFVAVPVSLFWASVGFSFVVSAGN